MVARIATVAFQGIDVLDVDVQVQTSSGLPAFTLVGLADKAVAESRERVRGALHAMGLALPPKRITVNLAPADLAKEGSHFDLPIALGLLAAMDVVPADDAGRYAALGELALDGGLAPVAGVLPAAIHAAAMDRGLICPARQGAEAAWGGEVEVLAAENLLQLVNHFRGTQVLTPPEARLVDGEPHYPDMADIKGQENRLRYGAPSSHAPATWTGPVVPLPKEASTAPVRVRRGEKPHYRIKNDDPEALRRRRNSVNRSLAIFKAALNRAYEYGHVDSNLAWGRVKGFRRVDPEVPLYLEKEQCTVLLEACQPDLRDLAIGALTTGCRVGELRRMRVGDYLPDLQRLIIKATKSGRLRHVSLSSEGARFFDRHTRGRQMDELMFLRSDGRPWRQCTHHRPFHKATYAAGINPKINFHSLRHTYATHAAMAGIPLAVIAKQLGHRDTRTVERHYAHFGSSYVDEVIQERLPSLVPVRWN